MIKGTILVPDPDTTLQEMLELAERWTDSNIDSHTAMETASMAEDLRRMGDMLLALDKALVAGTVFFPRRWMDRWMAQKDMVYPFCERTIVRALKVITEGGEDTKPDPGLKPIEGPGYIHAWENDLGVVVGVDSGIGNIPTVRFYRTGTATIVGDDEVAFVGVEMSAKATT
jgi:hypothetical protein